MILTFCYTFIIRNQASYSQLIFQINCLHIVIDCSYVLHKEIKRTAIERFSPSITVLIYSFLHLDDATVCLERISYPCMQTFHIRFILVHIILIILIVYIQINIWAQAIRSSHLVSSFNIITETHFSKAFNFIS